MTEASQKTWALATWLDPVQYVQHATQSSVVQTLESARIPAIPVYAHWARIDCSSHEALFQETGHHDNWDHIEVSLVAGFIPMYQKFTGNVWGDANPMALQGHDTGPGVPHLSLPIPPVNMLLAMHMLSSSCKWPISARRRLHRNKSLCAFASLLAPYQYCSSKEKKEEKGEDDAEPGPKAVGVGAKAKAKANATIKAMKGEGIGITMIPGGGKTVFLQLSVMDIILGVVDVLISKGVNMAFDKVFKWGTNKVGMPGRDAKQHIRQFSTSAAWKVGRREAALYMRDTMINKAWKNAAKGFAMKFEIGVPFKLASINFPAGEVKVWTWTFGDWYREWEPPSQQQAPSQQQVEQASTDDLVCSPGQEGPFENDERPLGPYDPNRSSFFDELAMEDPPRPPQHEPEPIEPTQQAGPSSQPTPSPEPPPREDFVQDQWLEPESQDPLEPDPNRQDFFDEFFEGVPHAW